MTVLPANQKLRRRDAFYMTVLKPLEDVTASLRRGDEWELEDLTEVDRRCRALADAYDLRMKDAQK